MPARSKPQVPISGLGWFDGAGAGSEDGAGAADATLGVDAGAGGAVGAGVLDPQPAIVATIVASNRVFTGGLQGLSGAAGVPGPGSFA
jgi:hypothetical protein